MSEERYERVLVVGAHPDDPEFVFGGTIAWLTEDGAAVSYLICSDGCQGSDDVAIQDAELSATRYAEQRDAAAVLGVTDVVFLGLRDGSLAPTVGLRRAIAREIRRSRPDLVLTHAPERLLSVDIGFSHPDHLAVGSATLGAVYPDARNPRAYSELLGEGFEPHRVKEVWIPGLEHADHHVDVSALMDRKIEAVLRHRSQFGGSESRAGEVAKWVRDRARQVGATAGFEYAERYRKIRTG